MSASPRHLGLLRTVPWAVLVLLVAGGCERSSWQPPQRWERAHPRLVTPVHDLLRDPTDPDVIYAACGWQTIDLAQRNGGVLRSDDRGLQWSESNTGLPRKAEVLTLVAVPHQLLAAEIVGEGAAEATTLLAGTRKSGLYGSVDGGRSWSGFPDPEAPRWDQLTLQTIVVLPGAPRALALGSKEHGVLLSEDGGRSWQIRDAGLQNPSVQRLVLAPDGSLLAATWYGGIYRTEDRGLRWESLSREYERASVSTLALSDDGTLWLGLQNGGLLAASFSGSSSLSFEPQGPEVIGDAGILALAIPEIQGSSGIQGNQGVSGGLSARFAETPGVIVGTSGRGAAFGHLGGRFTTVTEGLENSTVSAVLLTDDDPDDILIGTWSGLYRGVPPPSRAPGLAAAIGLLVLVGVMGWIAWRRSATAAGRKLFREFLCQEQERAPFWWDRRIGELSPDRAAPILHQFAHQLRRSRYSVGIESAFFLGTASLCEALHQIEGQTDRDSRHRIADVLEKRALDFGRLADKLESLGQHLHTVTFGRVVSNQDVLYAQFLRAESLGHLTVLRQRYSEVVFDTSDPTTGRALGDLLEAIEQLGRISGSEDRALYLGQALSRTLEALDQRKTESLRPSERRIIGTYVLEATRDLLVNALRNIHHCAELRVKLHSKLLTTQREAVVVLELENIGQGPAQNLAVELQDDEGFRALRRRRELKSLMRGQSARLEFLVEPQVSDRVRLRFHIAFDDLERQGQRREFADMVEFRKLGEHRAFTPLRPNPYVVGRPLVESDIFMGREDTFELLEASLRGAQQDNVVVLMGPRRMGKTSILRRLSDHLGTDYVPVLVDLQGMIGSGETAFFRELTAVIHDELDEAGIEVPEPPAEAFESDPGGAFRRKFLKSIRRTLGERRLLLLFDEFEVLEARIRTGDLEPRILPYFRSLMQHERSISFVFAGTHRLDELTRDYWGVLFNLAIYLEVGHLSRSEVEQLFVEPTRAFFEIDPLALDKVFQLTGGHPHFSQLLARELIELRNQRKLAYITIQDLNEVADRVTEKGQLHISYLWEDGSRTEQLFLLALKERLERTGMATLNAVQNSLDQYPTETYDPAVALRQLVRREILVDNAGLLSFRIELLKLWLDRNLDAESFILSEPHPRGS